MALGTAVVAEEPGPPGAPRNCISLNSSLAVSVPLRRITVVFADDIGPVDAGEGDAIDGLMPEEGKLGGEVA